MSMDGKKTIAAGEFKQRCLAILDEVAEQHGEYIVTKRGRPVARVVPVVRDEDLTDRILAELRGRGRMLVDESAFLEPFTDEAGWNLDDD